LPVTAGKAIVSARFSSSRVRARAERHHRFDLRPHLLD
jgi:hypothetical protein